MHSSGSISGANEQRGSNGTTTISSKTSIEESRMTQGKGEDSEKVEGSNGSETPLNVEGQDGIGMSSNRTVSLTEVI